jgi:hypothetical protein
MTWSNCQRNGLSIMHERLSFAAVNDRNIHSNASQEKDLSLRSR